ncbi:TadE family protein [Streptomyces sp. CAU 1734]|uniref:TadE/TadG family type IV pilus assembly protein n=1 Tax=Streptomyces sp. CAU 1734 TaxID=3140360 RepID=UPI003260FB76
MKRTVAMEHTVAVKRAFARLRSDRGQAAVEFTGTIPVILATLALLWQAALVGYTFSLAGNAADEGARAGAVGGDAACRQAARQNLPAAWRLTEIDCGRAGELYRADLEISLPVLFPGSLSLPIPVPGNAAAHYEEAER